MRIVILNNKWEAADYGKYHRAVGDIIFPIGPLARYYALENKWEICTLESLFSKEEYFKAKNSSEKRIITVIKELNAYSRSIANNFPLTIGDYFHFQLHIVIGQIHYNRFIIDSLQNNLKPDSWLMYQPENPKTFMDFRPDPNIIFSKVFENTPYFNSSYIIKYTPIESPKRNKDLKRNFEDILPEDIFNRFFSIKQKLKTKNLLKNRKKSLLMVGGMCDWEPLLSDSVFRSNYYVDYISRNLFHQKEKSSRHLDKILNRSVIFDKKPMFELQEQAEIVQASINYFDSRAPIFKKKINKFDALLASGFSWPKQNYLGHIGNLLGKPVILWQHGEMNLYEDIFTESVETRYTTHYFCYGSRVAPKYESFIGKSPLKQVFTVGSTKKNIEWESGEYILYATGKWKKTCIAFEIAVDADTRLYNAQNDILSYLDEVGKKHKIIFKPNNSSGLNEIPFDIYNIKIEYRIPFAVLLKNAKMVILDTPGTTCIETCSTTVPLFILTGRVPWYDQPLNLLKKRAVLSDTTESLIKKVNKYLDNGYYSADPKNTEFFKGYGSIHNIKQVKYNAIGALDKIIG